MFCVDDNAVCVNSKSTTRYSTNLVEGKVYPVLAVERCVCGSVQIDVGVSIASGFTHVRCQVCHKDLSPGVAWKKQTRFAPVDAIENIEEQIHQALKGITRNPLNKRL